MTATVNKGLLRSSAFSHGKKCHQVQRWPEFTFGNSNARIEFLYEGILI